MENSKRKILLVGPYPPPYGGISTQIERLRKYMDQMGSVDCQVINVGKNRREKIPGVLSASTYADFIFKLSRFCLKKYTCHLVTNGHNFKSWLSAFCCALVGLLNGKKTVVTFGSGLMGDYMEGANSWVKWLIRRTLSLSGAVVCRNEKTKNILEAFGVAREKVRIMSGFLGVDPSLVGSLPPGVADFIATHRPIIGAHATDSAEYGIPLLIEAVRELRKGYKRMGLVLVGLDETTGNIVQNDSVRESIFLTGVLPHGEALAVVKSLDLFVRATYFDGDANSVREALALNIPVVASDTDYRPDGVVLFEKGNVHDLVKRVDQCLKDKRPKQAPVQSGNVPKNLEVLFHLYDEVPL